MAYREEYLKVPVLVVGAGPAGLAAAIAVKKQKPDIEVCVVDKAPGPGNHNLSGAVIEAGPLHELLDMALPDWRQGERAAEILGRTVDRDNVLMFLGRKRALTMMPPIKIARLLRLGFGNMVHKGDYSLSISKLTKWLCEIAEQVGVEVIHGFAAEDIVMRDIAGRAVAAGVKLVDQGRDHEGRSQPNYVPGETIRADIIILAEGCDGLVTGQFSRRAGLVQQRPQLFSVGVKEIIRVSDEQYARFGRGRCVHAMGWPLWTPLIGPGMFGGGIMYTAEDNLIAVGMIVGADWKYRDFNPQDALVRFKEHRFVRRFIEGGEVVEAGAKMIPEGGYLAVPRDPETRSIGKDNVLIVGDSAGFVNMQKIKGLHNAIASGLVAGRAVAQSFSSPEQAARRYTQMLEDSPLHREMRRAQNFRQTVARFGNTLGMPLSVLGNLLPKWRIEPDYQAMTPATYPLKCDQPFDKDTFVAMGGVEHREEQPCHCEVRDESYCLEKCPDTFARPCITFCPAGVYELIHGRMKPANPSNCLHCKTCQNKCPYDNLRWHVPEGGGGPRYRAM